MNLVNRGPINITNNNTDRFTAYQFIRIGKRVFKFVFNITINRAIFVGILYFGENGFSKIVDSDFLGLNIDYYELINKYDKNKQLSVVKNVFNLFENYLNQLMEV